LCIRPDSFYDILQEVNLSKKNRKKNVNTLPEFWPRVLAHRGASSLAPENSLSAFKLARTLGCKGVELDIQLCATGELVVFHDLHLNRIAGLDAKVAHTSFDALRELDVGSHFSPTFAGEGIPLFEEVLETLGTDICIDIEIKTASLYARKTAQAVQKILERHKPRTCIISSFNPFALLSCQRLMPEVPTAAIYCSNKSVPWYLRHRECVCISRAPILKPERSLAPWSPERPITSCAPTLVWTVDDRKEAERLLAGGVTSVITNRFQDMSGL